MVQTFFPIFPEDIKMINSEIGVKTVGEKIIYFNSGMPIFQHYKGDYNSFRFITSQMIELKVVRHVEIIQAFGVSKESVNRWLKTYRTKGIAGFFNPPPKKNKAKY